jgi:hypothetical protein
MKTPALVLDAYGEWIDGLAAWSHFVTLTHALPDSSDANKARGYTRVGVQRHRRMVREWFHKTVRRADASARWWSETELHESGQPHEHGLLAVSDARAATYGEWAASCGYMKLHRIQVGFSAARYVAKYTGKATSLTPMIFGFGLGSEPSFSTTFGGLVR